MQSASGIIQTTHRYNSLLDSGLLNFDLFDSEWLNLIIEFIKNLVQDIRFYKLLALL